MLQFILSHIKTPNDLHLYTLARRNPHACKLVYRHFRKNLAKASEGLFSHRKAAEKPLNPSKFFGKSFTASIAKRLRTFFSQVFLVLASLKAQKSLPATKKPNKIIYIHNKKTILIEMNLPADFSKKNFRFWRTKKKVCIPPPHFFFLAIYSHFF